MENFFRRFLPSGHELFGVMKRIECSQPERGLYLLKCGAFFTFFRILILPLYEQKTEE